MKQSLYLLLFLSIACENVLVNDPVSTDQQAVFDQLWNDFDRNYAGFTVRNMDWDSVLQRSTGVISSGVSQEEFKQVVINILLSFEDIHVGFVGPDGDRVVYRAANPNSVNGIASLEDYVSNFSESRVFNWGQITGENIGYIHIKTFNEGLFSDFSRIDEILAQFSTTDGLIIDVRNNSGGAPASANLVASRFIDHSFVAIKTQFRNGPDHDDFDTPLNGVIQPGGPFQYLKPIVILMNKSSQSAAELFVSPLEIQDHVTTVGDFTAGGLGLNSYRELSNGWNYRLTTALTSNRDNEVFERTGIPPHELVFITKEDSIGAVDHQLERAIEQLN